jgi:dipeptidyl aminopeptidase/acylaminoacyl peptidase
MTFDAVRLTRLRRLTEVVPSPDGRWLAVAVSRLDDDESKYVSDLWRVPATGGETVRLTRGPARDHTPRFRPDGSLAFLSNRNPREGEAEPGDDQRDQVWVLPAGGGEPVPLTDEPLGVTDVRFGGDRMVVIADVLPGVAHEAQRERAAELAKHGPSGLRYRRMPVRHWDHWLPLAAPHVIAYDPEGTRRDLTPEADREHRPVVFGIEWDLSPDSSRVVVGCMRPGPDRIEDVHLRVIEVATGAARDLGLAEGVWHSEPRFAPDGRRIACVRDVRVAGQAMHPHLWLFDGEDPSGAAVAGDWDAWPALADWTPDGRGLIVTADTRGQVPVYRVDVGTGRVERVTAATAGGAHASVRVVGTGDDLAVVGLRHRIVHPPEPFRCPLREGAEPALLANLSGFEPAEGEALVTVGDLEAGSDDGFRVHTLVVEPRERTGDLPVLLWIHGGPMGQHGDLWHWRWNPLVPAAAGYAVALPNPRGSTGYGQACVQGIWNNEWGGACYRDLMAVTDALERRPGLDPERIAAMGGSFGGYMANWIGANTNRYRCLMTHAGIYWLPAFHGTTDYPGFFAWEMQGTPYDDHEAFSRYSPHRLLDGWKTPTLIIHGERDYRVPISEALLLFEGLQARGVESELLVFPDENHWILRPRNARLWYQSVLEFAARHMA